MKKQTKIVATISTKHCEVEFLTKLYEAGMNVVRLNTAHFDPKDAMQMVNNIRKVSETIAILLDTKGPEIRTTVCEPEFEVTKGQRVFFKGDNTGITTPDCIYTTYDNFVDEIPIGTKILIDDGSVEFIVIEKTHDKLVCEVENDGKVQSRKSINVPSVHINLPSLNEKDKQFIDFAIENDLDFIAHSFVRNKQDILAIQNILDAHNSKIKIIAKIENQQGVDNIDEILEVVYGVMVARGDMAIEIPAEKVPSVQKMLERKCISQRKPVIVATQMLHTMINNPRPTRAEVSDVANAIFDGTDAIMLSGETASGLYPIEAVEVMTRIALEVESTKRDSIKVPPSHDHNEITTFLAKATVEASIMLGTKSIVADSMTGLTIRELASYRGKCPIYAICYDKRTMREMALSYGVYADYQKPRNTTDEFLSDALTVLLKRHHFDKHDLIVVLAGNFGTNIGASFVEISTVGKLLERQHYFLKIREAASVSS